MIGRNFNILQNSSFASGCDMEIGLDSVKSTMRNFSTISVKIKRVHKNWLRIVFALVKNRYSKQLWNVFGFYETGTKFASR